MKGNGSKSSHWEIIQDLNTIQHKLMLSPVNNDLWFQRNRYRTGCNSMCLNRKFIRLGWLSKTKIRNFVNLQQQPGKDKTLFEKLWMNMEFGRSPTCYFAGLFGSAL